MAEEIKWSDDQKAVFDARGNTLVSASAGSGKTTVLIEKIIRLLEEGADLRRILVMTFSRASAMDMKSKLVAKLRARSSFGKEEMIRKQLDNVPFANISTINSFCYTLMKRNFSVISADPSCSILDENEQKSLLNECLDRVLEKETVRGDESFFTTLEFFSKRRNTDEIKSVILSLRAFLTVQEDPEGFLESARDSRARAERYYFGKIKEKIAAKREECRRVLAVMNEEGFNQSEEKIRALLLTLERAAEGGAEEIFREARSAEVPRAFSSAYVTRGRISEELCALSASFFGSVRQLFKELNEVEELYRDRSASDEVVRVLLRLYDENEKEYAMRKKQRSAVDFNDAERAALRLLQNEEVREEIAKNYDHVFIDEYQDTNYLQEAILRGVSRDNLFTVGDVKQAIYRFRFAEPQIFRDRKQVYEHTGGGNVRLLNDNYRSCERILTFTNEVCSAVMTESFGGVAYEDEAMLHSGSGKEGEEDAVRIYTYREESEDENIEPGAVYRVKTAPKVVKRDREACFIADEITREVLAGRGYDDFAVLVRKGDKIFAVAEELRKKGIPYYIARDRKSVLPERETLVDCLRLLVYEEDIPLVNVLSSEMFGFDAAELAAIRESAPDLSLCDALRNYRGEGKIEAKKDRFLRRTESWRFMSNYLSVADLMREILRDGYDAGLLKKGREAIEQINAFVYFVERQAEKMSVGEFLRYYDTVYDGNVSPAPPSCVKLMTLHGSKGLEFPVVFLPYVSDGFGKRGGSNALLCDRDIGMAVRKFEEEGYRSKKTFVLHAMEKKQSEEEREGEIRLAYVAFTRAQQKLIVIGKEKTFDGDAQNASCIMDWLLYTREKNGGFSRYFLPLPEREEQAFVSPPTRPKSLDLTALEKVYPYAKSTATYAKTSVTGMLEKHERIGVKFFPEESEAIDRGNAMHAFLRYVDFGVRSVEEVTRERTRLVAEGFLTEEEGALIDDGKIFRLLDSPRMRSIARCTAYREYPFIARMSPDNGTPDKILVQGVVDLLVALPDDTFLLLDYKMSVLGSEKLKERYTEQIKLYKNAVESILKKPVSKSFLYNLDRGYFVPME